MRNRCRDFSAGREPKGGGSPLPRFSLLDFFGFDDQLRKRGSQTVRNRLSSVEIWASLPALQKSNVSLMESGLGGKGRSAETFCPAVLFHHRSETVG